MLATPGVPLQPIVQEAALARLPPRLAFPVMHRFALCVVIAASTAATLALPAPEGAYGAIFPGSGSDAYDVSDYDLSLSIANRDRRFGGQVTISAAGRRDAERVSLDAGANLKIASVTRNGQPVEFLHRRTKLILALDQAQGESWRVTVRYRGRIKRLIDGEGVQYGWVRDGRNNWLALTEPAVTRVLMPVNDTPADQASYRFSIGVPRGYVGVANGRLVSRTARGGRPRFVWELDGEIPPYAAVVGSGRWRLFHDVGGSVWNVARKKRDLGGLRHLSRYQRFLEARLGEHPYGASGGIALPNPPFALETATRPVYWSHPGGAIIVHEMAHDWFGNSVSIADWRQIWLNEGPATWFEWLWGAHRGNRSIRARITRPWCRYRNDWDFPTANPGPNDDIFSSVDVYWRGGLVMELLRRKVGTKKFLTILRRWTTENRFESVETSEFIALAEQVAGESLAEIFAPYLYGKRPIWPAELMGFRHRCRG